MSDYLLVTGTDSIHLDKNFILFLMLLRFMRHSKFDIDFLSSTRYRNVKFSLQSFSKYVNPKIRSTNYYQVKKLRLFLTSVQSNLFVSYFACNEFGRLATIPKIIIKKSKSSGWFVSIWVLDDLCNHHYSEKVGFEPTEACTSSDFKSDAIDQLCHLSKYFIQ